MSDLGRIAGPIRAFVEAVLGRRLDYHALYPASVVSQSASGLAIVPDDERVRGFGLEPVPIKTGIPGTTVTVVPGARVLLGFEAADPKRPYCALWEPGSLDTITVTAATSVVVNAPTVDLAAAVAAVLRNGEIVNITGVMAGAGVIGATITLNPATFPGAGGASDVNA